MKMKPTILVASAILTVGFTAWFLSRQKFKLFDDVSMDVKKEDFGADW